MTEFFQRIKDLPANKLALLATQLQERLEQAESRARLDAPIAVVGVGCRFPGGAVDPESYWELLLAGRDAISDIPADRWDAGELYDPDWRTEGKMATRWGGFLDEVDHFDARLFGISPREAIGMDPQQRLLLEVSRDALERAGIAPGSLQGSRTGVFVGLSSTDYLALQNRRGLEAIDGYLASGAAPSVAAGRVAYLLGLTGPALTVDTACSSSLVAVHLAVQALRTRQCDAAIGAGVNVILSPVTSIALSKAQMMAADGRCKAFAASADGFVRGEGCGVVVLKRLEDAERDGDVVVGVIKGSAVNQDGRSNGLTAPNGPSQESVIAAALADAGLDPADIGFVEAHGTGTKLGDPIEVQALGAVLGRNRPASRRLRIGSVKSNLGHLESAAGMAGMIKAMLVLEHDTIPPHLHLDQPSPVIPWASLPIDVPTTTTAWAQDQPRYAGVSSFGFSGTNAHLILAAPPGRPPSSAPGRPVEVLTVSAQSEPALQAQAARLADHLATQEVALPDVCRTLNLGRDAFAHREAFVAGTIDELREDLHARGQGEHGRHIVRDHVDSTRPARPVWLFTGQGSQYSGMGGELYDAEPVVAEVLDRCDAFLRERFDLPLLEVMLAGDDPRIHQTGFTQPALFSLEVALAALWRSWGVHPAAVIGHSVGEYAAAHVAGLFGLEDGLTLIASRSQLMQALPSGGRMVAVLGPAASVEAALAPLSGDVAIAAVNGPDSLVLSGDADAVQAVLDRLDGTLETRELEVSHAFHSRAVDGMVESFGAVAAGIRFTDPQVPIVSNVFGEPAGRDRMGTAGYWQRHVREPVLFGPSLAGLVDARHRLFLELGPQPTLVGMAVRALPDPSLRWFHSLRKGRADEREMASGLAAMWASGVAVDWGAWHGPTPARREILPTYPMQRERFWIDGVAPWGREEPTAPAPPTTLDGLVYEVDWVERAHPAELGSAPGRFLRPVGETIAALDGAASGVASTHGIAAYDEFLPELDALCAALVLAGLDQLGPPLRDGDRISEAQLFGELGVQEGHRRLARRLLELLGEDGWLERDGDGWVVTRDDRPDALALEAALADRFPAFTPEARLVSRCGAALAGILRGEVDALDVLFPGGSSAQMEAIYRDAPMGRTFNELVGRAVASAVAATPAGRPLRILEIGAGSGATTDSVLAGLDDRPIDYLFTDISPAFTVKARERFRANPSVRFATFDAAAEPTGQGLDPGSFDLIVAANVVHATPRLDVTLGHLRSLLAPGGQLILLEATTRERFADLTVGFMPGWWAFEDTDLRPDYALLSREAWRGALTAAGFTSVAVGPTDVEEPALRREAVIVASAPDAGTPEGPAEVEPRDWLVVGAGALSDALAARLSRDGDRVARDPGGRREAIHDVVATGAFAGVMAVVEPLGTYATAVRNRHRARTTQLLSTVQGLLDAPGHPPLWIITQGAQAVAATPVGDAEAATTWGLSHVVELEHPELRCRRIDLGGGPIEWALDPLVRELRDADPAEPQLALRDERRFVRRLHRSTQAVRAPIRFDASASYIVSGGLRGLGLLVAGWMVDRGARQLVVFGRNEPTSAALAAIDQWRAQGAVVVVEQADAAVEADVARVVERAHALAPVRGVVHGAGTLADAALLRQDWGHFDVVFGPKVYGTVALLDHLDPAELDFLVLFSSGAGVAGSLGQANHAAANAYLDAVAHQLRARGVKAVSIDWGAWTGVGAAADRGIDSRPGSFSPEEGLAVLDQVLAGTVAGDGPAQVLVHSADWHDVLVRQPDGDVPSLYRDLLGSSADDTASRHPVPVPAAELRDRLDGLSERRQRQVMRDEIRRLAARVLDVDDTERIEVGQPLSDMGLDSLMAVELRNHLGVAMGTELPATLLFEHPTVNALVDHLLEVRTQTAPPARLVQAAPAPTPVEEVANAAVSELGTDELALALAARLERLGRRT